MLIMSKRSLEDIDKQFKSLLKTDDELFLENAIKNRFKNPVSTINSIYKRFDIYTILIESHIEYIEIDIFFSTPGMSEDILEKYIADNEYRFGSRNLSDMKRCDKSDEILSVYNKRLNEETKWHIFLHTPTICVVEHYTAIISSYTFSGPKQKSMYEIDITRGLIHKKIKEDLL
jgi:hypothetical protein